jgi:hypothetical protein
MKIFVTIASFLLMSLSFAAPGGEHKHSHGKGHGHSHGEEKKKEIFKEQTGEIGRQELQRLIKEEKIDSTWIRSKFDKSILKKNEWIVTFINEKGVKGKKIYIFLKKSGKFVAANFTGK